MKRLVTVCNAKPQGGDSYNGVTLKVSFTLLLVVYMPRQISHDGSGCGVGPRLLGHLAVAAARACRLEVEQLLSGAARKRTISGAWR